MIHDISFPSRTHRLVAVSALAAVIAGCAGSQAGERTTAGVAIGTVAGAVLGAAVDDGGAGGILAGAAAGALAGGLVGNYVDQQQAAFEEELAEERRLNQLEIERLENDVLKLSLNNEVSFDFGRAEVKPAFYESLDKLSDVVSKYDRTVVHVVGHTDSVGSEGSNQLLSERRANAVGTYMMRRGVDGDRVRTAGEGELRPRATNETEAGRQLNRRVEIFLKPIVEGAESDAYTSPVI